MVMERDLTWGDEHIIHIQMMYYRTCTPETYTILSKNVTSINSIKKKEPTHSQTRKSWS